MSPDPYGGSYDFGNPQSFNRYSYVKNNPLSLTDASGLMENNCIDALCTGDGGWGDDGCDPIFYDCSAPVWVVGVYAPGAPKIRGYRNLDPRILNESLGLPPGMLAPSGDILNIFGIGSGTGCEFGVCGDIGFGLTNGMTTAGLASCAANSASSFADLLGFSKTNVVAQTFLGNDFSTATNLILGPGRGAAAAEAGISNPTPLNATAIAASRIGATSVDSGGVALVYRGGQYWGTSQLIPLASTVGGRVVSKAFVVFSAAKLVYDGASYGSAILKCAGVF